VRGWNGKGVCQNGVVNRVFLYRSRAEMNSEEMEKRSPSKLKQGEKWDKRFGDILGPQKRI